MGFLSFAIDAGKKLLGLGNDEANVKSEIESNSSSMPIENLDVKVEGDKIILTGEADDEAKEKAALIAGNIKGIKSVEFDGITEDSEENYYEIKSGDNLSKISKKFYGNANLYNKIFEANREVIKDMNLIYPGQKIRIPKNG
ncbi:peptidoglycan-binding protein LysM [Arcobacter sp. LA11]|uniref:peptidoglycan-binding protein LysM n=1 Tax=Arcobacter sp. LA11 TaxID=1898176 RepID=UPI00093490E2|nr:peptidoglycan-binding protein LysM [Arcobacter sp. LA11]